MQLDSGTNVLPRTEKPAPPVSLSSPRPKPVKALLPLRALILDDIQRRCDSVRRALSTDNFRCRQVCGLSAARAALREATYDICIVREDFASGEGLASLWALLFAERAPAVLLLTVAGPQPASESEHRSHLDPVKAAMATLPADTSHPAALPPTARLAVERTRRLAEMRTPDRTLESTLDALPARIALFDDTGQVIGSNPAWRRADGDCVEMAQLPQIGTNATDLNRLPGLDQTTPNPVEWRCSTCVPPHYYAARRTGFSEQGQGLTVISYEDMSPALRARDAREKEAQEQSEAEKMRALGRLSGGVAHHFNNLLTTISGDLDLTLARLGEDDRATPSARRARQAAERAASITHHLLALSERQLFRPVATDLNQIVEEAAETLRCTHGNRVDVRALKGQVYAWSDPGQLRRALINLGLNALDASPDEGSIRFHTGTVSVGPGASVAPGAYAFVRVRDWGTGMNAEVAQRAFEAFFSTRQDGVGLGLSSARGVVRQCGGLLRARSRPEHGSTFDLILPGATPSWTSTTQSRSGHRPGCRLLLVEDTVAVRDLLREILEEAGYEVTGAGNGREALEKAQGCEFDLVITDLLMPGMSGTELIQELRQTDKNLPALVVSGYAGDQLPQVDELGERTAFLRKPFDSRALLRLAGQFSR